MRLLRFHLSTALIVMIAAGALVGINVTPNVRVPRAFVDSGSELKQLSPVWRMNTLADGSQQALWEYFPAVYCQHECTTTFDHYGWPLNAGTRERVVDDYGPRANPTDVELRFFNGDYGYAHEAGVRKVSWSFSASKIVGNVAVAAALLFILALFCEIIPGWLRRRFKFDIKAAS
jgi:hypothetical protein